MRHPNEIDRPMVDREERVATELPLRYRSPGQLVWHRAKTENISRSGVLFKGAEALPVNEPVEMALEMLCLTPMKLASVANVLWYGNVVRTVQPAASDADPAIAAKVSDFTFLSDKTNNKF